MPTIWIRSGLPQRAESCTPKGTGKAVTSEKRRPNSEVDYLQVLLWPTCSAMNRHCFSGRMHSNVSPKSGVNDFVAVRPAVYA
eukprot:TsM_000832500 transcript=TsM_000832500 gene=TsM_000832500